TASLLVALLGSAPHRSLRRSARISRPRRMSWAIHATVRSQPSPSRPSPSSRWYRHGMHTVYAAGIHNSGAGHWQAIWYAHDEDASWIEHSDWNHVSRDVW